jgi:hypothetical protein
LIHDTVNRCALCKELQGLHCIGVASNCVVQNLPFCNIAATIEQKTDDGQRGVLDSVRQWRKINVASTVRVGSVIKEPSRHLKIIQGITIITGVTRRQL